MMCSHHIKLFCFTCSFFDVGLICTPPNNDRIGDVRVDKGMIDFS